MPLQTTNLPASTLATSLATTASSTSRPTFLVVYASLTGGRSWCGDCRVAEPFVNAKFSGDLEAAVVYAGQPAEWRTPSNPWRQEPFNITNLPTIVKVTPSGVWSKLIEGDVYDQKKLDAFVGQ